MIDPFTDDLAPTPETGLTYDDTTTTATTQTVYTLRQLNALVEGVLSHAFPHSYWLTAEVSELRVAANGHCYLTFIEKAGKGGSLVAKANAMVWAAQWPVIARKFRKVTGVNPAAGMKVMVLAEITFHSLYGYSLRLCDIEPTYTLGDVARRRREIIDALESDGVIDLNRQLTLPRLITRVAIISSPTAAGYEDFCQQLRESGYHFTTKLFAAIMQGERVEQSIIGALDTIAAEQDDWDVVVIIRGGGATSDLQGFDSYELGTNVAQFPLPILTGIGHERDDTVLDLVAHRRLKTPTAVAAFLIENRDNEAGHLLQLRQRLHAATQQRLNLMEGKLRRCRQRLDLSTRNVVQQAAYTLAHSADRLRTLAHSSLQLERHRLRHRHDRLATNTRNALITPRHDCAHLHQRLHAATARRLQQARQHTEHTAQLIRMNNPERILSMGFSLTVCNGQRIGINDTVRPGDTLTTRLAGGRTLTSTVTHTETVKTINDADTTPTHA